MEENNKNKNNLELLPAEILLQILDHLAHLDQSWPYWYNQDKTQAEQFYRLQQLRWSSKFFDELCMSYLLSKHSGTINFKIEECGWSPAVSAAYNGHKNLLDLSKDYWSFDCYEAAIISNRMDVYNHLRESKCPDYTDIDCLGVAVDVGQIEFVKLFPAETIKEYGHYSIMDHTTSKGHTELAKYFNTQFGIEIQPVNLFSAIRSRVSDCIYYVLEYIRQKGISNSASYGYVAVAAETGNIELLKHLRSLGLSWNYETPEAAAGYGHVECLQYALENGCLATSDTIAEAIRGGHIECVKLADKFGCGWPSRAQQIAVVRNNVECLKLAYLHDGRWWFNITNTAAQFGALNCLKYLHENGCEWSGSELNLAVAGRHMSCVKYLHEEQGLKWSENTCNLAATGGEIIDSTSDYIDRHIAIKNSAECLQYVHERGAVWNEQTCEIAAKNNQLACLKYAHENGCPWNANVRVEAIKNEFQDILDYAEQHNCPQKLNSSDIIE